MYFSLILLLKNLFRLDKFPRTKLKYIFIYGDEDVNSVLNGKREPYFLIELFETFDQKNIDYLCFRKGIHLPIRNERINVKENGFLLSICIVCDRIVSIFLKNKRNNFRVYYWKFRLKKLTDAEKLITICVDPLIIKVAREINLRVIEVLHGFGYHTPKWGWDLLGSDSVPHEVICFDQKSFQTFSSVNKGIEQIHLCRPPLAALKKPIKNSRKKILFTLQHGYDGSREHLNDILKNGFFPEELEILIRRNSEDWIVKMHPVLFSHPRYSNLTSKIYDYFGKFENVNLHDFNDTPVSAISVNVDLHLTMSSMSVHDCAHNGVRSLTLCPTLLSSGSQFNKFEELEKTGMLCKMHFNQLDNCRFDYHLNRDKPQISHDFAHYPSIGDVVVGK